MTEKSQGEKTVKKPKRKAPIANLPSGVGVYRAVNGQGFEHWLVRLGKRYTGGEVVRRSFTKLSDARNWINGGGKDKKQEAPSPAEIKNAAGSAGFSLTTKQLGEAIAAQKLLDSAKITTGIYEAVEFYIRHTRPEGGEKLIEEVIVELLKERKLSGRKESYLKGLGWSLRKFGDDFKTSYIHEITKDDFLEWLEEEDFTLATRRNYIRDCGILFNFAHSRKWLSTVPTDGIGRPAVEDREIKILSIRQIARLLLTAQRKPEFRPYLAPIAIQLFAGVRTSEIKRLDWEQVRSNQIVILASNAKTRQRRTITISDALASWIAEEKKESGLVFPKGKCWRMGFTKLVEAAKITPWPRNALRHSFGSYHFAHFKNENLTAAEMGNSPQMIFKHYRAVVLDGDEARFWNLINKKQEGKVVPFKVA